MNIRHSLLLPTLSVIAVLNIMPAAIGDTHKEDTAAISSELAKTDTAMENKDATGAVAFTASSFVSYDVKGRETIQSKTEALKGMAV